MEFFGEKAIGLDVKKRKLVYVDTGRKKPFEACIYLKDFRFCLLSETKDSHPNKARISLELVSARKNENVLLNFFHYASDTNYRRPELTRKAQYWKNKINQLINVRKTNTSLEYVV
jgi:hypothetical protein